MAYTANYNLYTTDDSSETFKSFRENLCGMTNSNMTKIDDALAGKAANSITINATLSASAWEGITIPYTQTLTIDGLGEEQNGTIFVSQDATADERESARNALLSVTGQGVGTLTISSDGDVPVIDIPVTIILLG